MALTVIGVMGPGEGATEADCATAKHLGSLIAREGWATLTGGRPIGVMNSALIGAKQAGGLTVGILPGRSFDEAADSVDVPVLTGMNEARNLVNVLTSQVVLVVGMSAGTASEVALALKSGRPTILINPEGISAQFWKSIGRDLLHISSTPEGAIDQARIILSRSERNG